MVVTAGPASVNPDTGKRYGSSFPVVSMKDSVRVHKALLDSLGVKKLQAVAGASGGSIQAMEWGAEYPQLVERVIHVIGPGLDIHPYVIGLLDIWMMPIKLDPNWKGGDYFGGPEPAEGLAQSLKTITLTALHHGWAEKVHGYNWAAEGKNPNELCHPSPHSFRMRLFSLVMLDVWKPGQMIFLFGCLLAMPQSAHERRDWSLRDDVGSLDPASLAHRSGDLHLFEILCAGRWGRIRVYRLVAGGGRSLFE
jgi:pimeloyl-ACP methyl ester carboxylesterase